VRGQWKGMTEGVVLGGGMYHREGDRPGEPRTVSKEFTLNITDRLPAPFRSAYFTGSGRLSGVTESGRYAAAARLRRSGDCLPDAGSHHGVTSGKRSHLLAAAFPKASSIPVTTDLRPNRP